MGNGTSSYAALDANEHLARLAGRDVLEEDDPFWDTLLGFSIPYPPTANDQIVLETKTAKLLEELVRHNASTGRLGALIRRFLKTSGQLHSCDVTLANTPSWQSFNALFIIRCALKYLAETVSEPQLLRHIDADGSASPLLEDFLGALLAILVDVPVADTTYAVHLEAVTSLLVLLSLEPRGGAVSHLVMRGRHAIHAPPLVRNLLHNYVEQRAAPEAPGGIISGLASNLWSVLTLGASRAAPLEGPEAAPLAASSLMLVLVLAHHWTGQTNPYRGCLFSCVGSAGDGGAEGGGLFKVDFGELYAVLCGHVDDASTLLLYLLVHGNAAFRRFLMARTDIELLIIPILKKLYNAPKCNPQHVYMSLIVLLIFSEDETFNRTIHETKVKQLAWYTERNLADISLGGALILVVIRTIQYNIMKMRDKYMHTNCLAALANMSSHFRDLHPYVSQRFVSLLETIARKHHKLKAAQRLQNGSSTTTTIDVEERRADLEQDVAAFEEVLRMVLEILNSCLCAQLTANPNLVYTLLYNRQLFESLAEQLVFSDVVHNISLVIGHFAELLRGEEAHAHAQDAHEVLAVIREGGRRFARDRLTKFPELRFKYVEEEQPEEFFVPYVWALAAALPAFRGGRPT